MPTVPDYDGACLANVVPALLDPGERAPAWLPPEAGEADQVVLLLIDGLGWRQLAERPAVAPTLTGLAGGPIVTVAPSTTATALTSVATGAPPGLHGVVGYRAAVQDQVLNVLRWSVANRDARQLVPPDELQRIEPFLGQRPPVVTRADFRSSGFTTAHLDGVRFTGYRVTSTLLVEVARLARAGEPFVYAYYDGIDKVAHEYGVASDQFDAEVRFVDGLVADILGSLPPGAALVVTADHGQVDVGDRVVKLHPEVLGRTRLQSGEGRFRWLHAAPGESRGLLQAATEHHGDQAWVHAVDEIVDGGWFGPVVSDEARARLGDVAVVAREPVAFFDPDDSGPFVLIGRHGSLTEDEMLVPLLARRV